MRKMKCHWVNPDYLGTKTLGNQKLHHCTRPVILEDQDKHRALWEYLCYWRTSPCFFNLIFLVCVSLSKLYRMRIQAGAGGGGNEKMQHFNALKRHAFSTHLFLCYSFYDSYRTGIFTQNPVVKRKVNDTVLLKSSYSFGRIQRETEFKYIYICMYLYINYSLQSTMAELSRPLNLKEICYWGRQVGYFEDMSDVMEGLWRLLQP